MSKIKQIIKKIVGNKTLNYMRFIKNRKNMKNNNDSFLSIIRKSRLYSDYSKLFKNVNLCNNDSAFYYSIDYYKSYLYDGDVISNLMIDYSKILDYSLLDYKNMLDNNEYHCELKKLIDSIDLMIDREIEICNNEKIKESLSGIKVRKANSLFDAIQRILFFNQLLWQTGHNLNGLGRLDLILDKYYENDIKNNIIIKDEAYQMLKEFLIILHKDYYYKSSALSGDTGQIIILGGLKEDGSYFSNDLTYMFIDLMKELNKPDPKVLLRDSKNTKRELIEKSIDCISTGIGCPLFANDDVIIEKLVNFGYNKKDAYNYGTAACWEPFMTGKSFDQNNLKSISFAIPFNEMSINENIDNINSYNELLEKYKNYLKEYLINFIEEINKRKFGKDLFLSLLTDDCIKNSKDISCGGAKYNNYGFTGVALSNTINSIVSIREFVFDKKEYTFKEFNDLRLNNFNNNKEIIKKIKSETNKYGTDSEDIINLTNEIIGFTSSVLNNMKNPLGGKYKFGLSAPSYIEESKDFPATFDGRRIGEPFGVHISSDLNNAYTELFNFASKLDYNENRFNGNVIDFIVSPNFIIDNFSKFVDFIILSINNGFFEMQMNVVSSKTLIEARKNPEKFPNLIVRVWGFSSYFNDLPDEYKDYLIERALKSEGNSY